MKLEYEVNGYKVYKHKIMDYPVRVHETKYGCSVSVPMGETEQDKKMFDMLVYYKKGVYHAKTKQMVVNQVRNWIKSYKFNQ